jgi:hypothetical protein
MLSERTIINALILAAGLIIGPYLTLSTFEHNYWPLLIAGGVTFLLVVFFFVGNRICALPLLGLYFGGDFNFLPLGLSAADLCVFATILYYLVTYIALKQKALKTGPRVLLYPIMVIGLIVLYHQQSFGIHAFGGNKEGSRPAVLLLACVTAYVCGININHPPVTFLRRLPWYALALLTISSFPYIITTYYPEAANTLIYISSDLNLSAYAGEEIVREGDQAAIGAALQLVLLSYYPIYSWWRPERWWVAILSVVCFWLVAHGGFRSGMAVYGVSFLLGTWCYCSWRALILLPVCALALFGLEVVQSNNLVSLPLATQRSLAFLPGSWAKEVTDSAVSSNEFRDDLQRVYVQEYLKKSPLLGNGFTIDLDQLDKIRDAERTNFSEDGYYSSKFFIESKLFHIGWISVYDAVGLVGSLAFVLLGLSISYLSGRFIFAPGRERRSPLLPLRVWIFCNVTKDMIGYFTVFGAFNLTFSALCGYAIILAHLYEMERQPEKQAARTPERGLFSLPELGRPLPVGPLNGSSC